MKMKIGDITEIIDGDRGKNYPKKSDFKDEGFCLFLNTGNVTSDGFVFKKNDFISEEKSNKLRKGKLERGDLVFTTRGTVGNVAYYSDNIPYDHVRINSGMVIFRVFEKKVFNKFLYQILKHKNSRIYIRQYCTGSAQPQLPIMNLRNIELNIPPLETQYKIARILLAYDDLIENNERQIKLLEEAARRLYKEWFVDLHFPGYEDVEIVDGVPEGWVFVSINMVAKLKAGGDKPKTFSEKMTNENKIPVFANGITEKGLMGFTDKAVINNPSVTISARGTVGVVFLRTEPYVPIVRLISVTPIDDKIDILYLFLYLANQNFRSTGAAQQQITVPLLKSKNIVCPTDDVRKSFNDVITPIFNKIEILEKQIDFASEDRDRLLPKLMSGEIEV